MNKPSPVEWQEILMGEALLLGLLSRVIYQYPDRSWIQSLYVDDIFSEMPFAADQDETKSGVALVQQWGRKGVTDEAFERLKLDYTRLFIGVGKVLAPPWESVHLSEKKLIFQERTLEVRDWYKRFGLELLFLSHLASLGIQSLEKEDQTRFNELLDAQREFIKMHPGTWALTWCGLVERNAQTDFYKGFAYLTHGALFELSEVLDVKLAKDAAE